MIKSMTGFGRAELQDADKKITVAVSYTHLTLEKEIAPYKEQDEDVLTYALFPQVAMDFFKYRDAQKTKVDAKVADTENGAYPV